MAAVRSLGIHEPAAVAYLLAEGVLPPPSHYTWQTEVVKQDKLARYVEEEVFTTETCAVWSRAGIVKRVYNLDVEGERILRAFTTSFPQTKRTSVQHKPKGRHGVYSIVSTKDEAVNSQFYRPEWECSNRTASQQEEVERALVVVLKNQFHIFLLSGDSHVIPLSFEVEDAFPASQGFLLQRKLSKDEIGSQEFYTSGVELDFHRSHSALPINLQRLFTERPKHNEIKPRLFCFSEVLDEVGLVVAQIEDKKHSGISHAPDLSPLSSDEEIVYVSRRDELENMSQPSGQPLCLAVTQNRQSRNLTIWHAAFLVSDEVEAPLKKKKVLSSNVPVSKRKSSNIFGRSAGAATPSRTFQTRESFGVLAQSFSENMPNTSAEDLKTSQVVDLETQLGHDFAEVGVQTRSARRISSMLARTDLMAGHDRTMFNDINAGQLNRKSIKRTSRRGESIGGFGDRQSFGRRRSSFPTNASVMSNGTSFLEVPGAHLADDMNAHEDLQVLMDNDFADLNGGTPPQIAFTRIKSLPRSLPISPQSARASKMPKVFTLAPSRQRDATQKGSRQISLCIMDTAARELAIVNLKIYQQTKKRDARQETVPSELTQYVRGTEVRRGSNIIDACKVSSGGENRVVILTQTRDQHPMLHLEAPWTSPFRIYLPASLLVYNPAGMSGPASPDRRRVTGQHRVVKSSEISISGLENGGGPGEVLTVDNEGQRHQILIQLSPTNTIVRRVLNICRFVLPGSEDDGLLLAWWEVMRWLQSKNLSADIEYTALVIVIFMMALPFTTGKPGVVPSTPRKKKTGLLRSSSGTVTDMTSWDNMIRDQTHAQRHSWLGENSWAWTLAVPPVPTISTESRSHRSKASTSGTFHTPNTKMTFVLDCITYARDFLQSPAGETAIGPEGYLPTAMNKDREHRRTALPSVLISLHLYREELKLQKRSVTASVAEDLAPVIAQLGQWLGWATWTWREGAYYNTEITDVDQWLFEDTLISGLEMPNPPFDPLSIFTHVNNCIARVDPKPFPSLLDVVGRADASAASGPWRASAKRLTPRLFAITELLGVESFNQWTTQRLVDCAFDRAMLDSLPDGVKEALRKILLRQAYTSKPVISNHLLELLDENDRKAGGIGTMQASVTKPTVTSSHDAIRDYHSIGNIALDADNTHSWDATSEADRQGVTRLIFREDRRYQEASRLVNQTRPPMVECTPEPEWTEGDLLDAQKELAHTVAHRTLSVASGRGMMHFNAKVPLLTEKVPIPAFSLQCLMKPRVDAEGSAPMTFSADKASFTEDKVCWAFFHNGASAGLMISKDAKGIDTSWILYNKPPELTNRHAGFLLALGLTGHLKSLAKWVAFKYLTPKHTMTSIGLLLGLSVSYLGTMDTQITRLLSVHVTRLLPPGAAELNLSPLTQATSIMGIGLLYCRSQHRRMSEIMLSEIENNDPEEGVAEEALLRNEGYRLAAGFALGYINLGQGKRLHGLHDMGFVERLLAVAIGTKNVNLVHVLDRATAGATVAIALVFMKTNDESVAHKIDIPDTIHQFDYVRPDIFLLRTLARHLIMWNSIEPTLAFVKRSLPPAYRYRATLQSTKYLSTEDMPFFNIMAGICLALGLRFAGSGSHAVRDLLVSYLDQFIRLTRLSALNYDAKLTRNSVRNCQDVVALATSAVMAGTGDLIVLRRLRTLHGRTDQETPYGSHLAGHMAIGALFLGGGTYTFGTSNLAVASLLCAFYPLFPTDELDNKSHLQAFRHLWALAAEPRCIVCKDSESGKVVSAHINVDMKDGSSRQLIAPCLLPELADITRISSKEQGYWDVCLDLENEATKDQWIKMGLSLSLRPRAAFDAPASDLFVAELGTLAERGLAPSINTNANAGTFRAGQKSNDRPFDWLFSLSFLAGLDASEHALVLPPRSHGINDMGRLQETLVDTRLELENLLNGSNTTVEKDQLWQLRLLFALQDRAEEERREAAAGAQSGGPTVEEEEEIGGGLKTEVLDRLRWRVWNMTTNGGNEDTNNV